MNFKNTITVEFDKMQIPSVIVYEPYYTISLATKRGLRFGALTSVSALFLIGGTIMKEKLTDEQIAEAIGKLAQMVRDDVQSDYDKLRTEMNQAEILFLRSLDSHQYTLYTNYLAKKEELEKYVKEFNNIITE